MTATITRASSGFRPWYFGGKQIDLIKLHRNGEVVYDTGRGWIEDTESNRDVVTVVFNRVNTRRKLNLLDNIASEPFIIKEEQAASKGYPHSGYTLYIPADLVQYRVIGERYEYDTATERHYATYSTIVLDCALDRQTIPDSPDNITAQTIILKFNHRTEQTHFGKRVDEVAAELDEDGITITKYDLIRLMERYQLIRKGK